MAAGASRVADSAGRVHVIRRAPACAYSVGPAYLPSPGEIIEHPLRLLDIWEHRLGGLPEPLDEAAAMTVELKREEVRPVDAPAPQVRKRSLEPELSKPREYEILERLPHLVASVDHACADLVATRFGS